MLCRDYALDETGKGSLFVESKVLLLLFYAVFVCFVLCGLFFGYRWIVLVSTKTSTFQSIRTMRDDSYQATVREIAVIVL